MFKMVALQSFRRNGKPVHKYRGIVTHVTDRDLCNMTYGARLNFWASAVKRLRLLGATDEVLVRMKKKIEEIVRLPTKKEARASFRRRQCITTKNSSSGQGRATTDSFEGKERFMNFENG